MGLGSGGEYDLLGGAKVQPKTEYDLLGGSAQADVPLLQEVRVLLPFTTPGDGSRTALA